MGSRAEPDIVFLSLLLNLQGAALQQMGKMASPLTGEVERNLAMAKQSIDLLECLDRKTKGNLSEDEEKTFQEILTHLRLNYVAELQQEQQEGGETGEGDEDAEKETSSGGDSEDAATAGD